MSVVGQASQLILDVSGRTGGVDQRAHIVMWGWQNAGCDLLGLWFGLTASTSHQCRPDGDTVADF